MPTRREQLQAYRFVTRRIVSAMLSGDPESTDRPMRRLGLAVFGSVMVGTIVFAGIGVYGLLRPGGSTAWKTSGSLIVERETGARFVYTGGTLYPVVNYASARLLLGSPDAQPQTVSAASLAGVPRGKPVGIPGAPDSLPAANRLVGLPWSVCSAPRYANSATLATEVMVGQGLSGGAALGDRGLVVSQDTAAGTKYLLWHEHRLRIPGDTERAALELAGAQVTVVSQALLNSVPAGPDLAAPAVLGAGEPGRTVNGAAHRVGDVFTDGNGYYVLVRDGLAALSPVLEKLLTARGAPVTRVPPSALGGGMLASTRVAPDGLPDTVPAVVSLPADQPAVCTGYHGSGVRIETYQQAPRQFDTQDSTAAGVARGAQDPVRTAQKVIVPGGHGALVRAEPAPGVTAGTTFYLVTDQGYKFPLERAGRSDAVAALGYGSVRPVAVPWSVLDLVPTGPTLDQRDAGMPVAGSAASPSAGPSKQTG
jgi:type VII secretion protein EccB